MSPVTIYPDVYSAPSSPIAGTSHIPPPHSDVSHCLEPTHTSPLKIATKSSASSIMPSISRASSNK